jgi:hypothetical protein
MTESVYLRHVIKVIIDEEQMDRGKFVIVEWEEVNTDGNHRCDPLYPNNNIMGGERRLVVVIIRCSLSDSII